MARPAIGSLALRALTAVRPVRELAVRLELLRTVGPRAVIERRRQEARLAGVGIEAARDSLYGQIWEDAAREVGARVERLGAGRLRLVRGPRAAEVHHQFVPLNDISAVELVSDKARLGDLLRREGLPVPASARFSAQDVAPALAFLGREDGPVVLKPAAGTGGGLGVTGGVRTRADLLRATLKASRSAGQLLVERQIPGCVYRILLLDGEVLDVIERDRPVVVGDGRSSVARLMEEENERRLARAHEDIGYLLRADLDTVLALREQGISLHSVPDAGRRLAVKTITSQNGPDDNATYREELSDEFVEDVRRAAELIQLRLAGVDVVTADLAQGLRGTGGVILEVNGVPGLAHHQQVRARDAAPRVAVPILRALLEGPSTTTG